MTHQIKLEDLLNRYPIELDTSRDYENGTMFRNCPNPDCEKEGHAGIITNEGDEKYGYWSCFSCGAKGTLWTLRKILRERYDGTSEVKDTSVMFNDVSAYQPILATDDQAQEYLFTKRKISKKTAASLKYGADGKGNISIPYIKKHQVRFHRIKLADPPEDGMKTYVPEEDKGNAQEFLYNIDSLEKSVKENKEINGSKNYATVTEGEFDTASYYDYGFKGGCVSLPGVHFKLKAHDLKKLKKFDRVYLCIDSHDDAADDEEYKIASAIGIDKCYRVILPMKDMNECFMEGVPGPEVLEAFTKAKKIKPPGAESSDERGEIDIPAPISTGKPKLDAKLTPIHAPKSGGGWRPGFYIFAAETGIGKSAYAMDLTVNLIKNEHQVVYLPFEGGEKLFYQRLDTYMGEKDYKNPFLKVNKPFETDAFRSIDAFLNYLLDYKKYWGVTVFIADDLGHLFEDYFTGSSDVYIAQNMVSGKISRWCDRHGIILIALYHPRKEAETRGRNRDGQIITIPKFSSTDLHGGGFIGRRSCFIAFIWRNKDRSDKVEADEHLNLIQITKNRFGQQTGYLREEFDQKTTHYKEV